MVKETNILNLLSDYQVLNKDITVMCWLVKLEIMFLIVKMFLKHTTVQFVSPTYQVSCFQVASYTKVIGLTQHALSQSLT